MSKRIVEITGLRCFAVTMVVLGHARQTVDGGYVGWLAPLEFLSRSSQGVLLFFVLSGFLITGLLAKEYTLDRRLDLFLFYKRRALRIWPASYFYILTVYVLSMTGILRVEWREVVLAATHLWNYGELLKFGGGDARPGSWYLDHFWTLALEEQFYWIWPPILLYVLRRPGHGPVLALIVIIPLIRLASYFLAPGLRGQSTMMLHTGLDPILVGCYAALNREQWASRLVATKHRHWLLTGVVIAFVVVTPELANHFRGLWTATHGATVDALLAAFIILGVIHVPDFWLARLCRIQCVVFVGTISYSLYLWQQLFLAEHFRYALQFPFNIGQAVLMAAISYYLIELPLLRFKAHGAPRRIALQE